MTVSNLSMRIPAFLNGSMMPGRYSCDGEGASPLINISGVPEEAKSLALVMDDPDIPEVFKQERGINEYVHWVLFNIPPDAGEIPEDTSAGLAGVNSAGVNAYAGPCPPKEYEPSTHRYFFTLYALDTMLPLTSGATKEELEEAMRGRIIAKTQYVGLYKRI